VSENPTVAGRETRQSAEMDLLQSEERFRHLVEGILDYAIYILDCNGNIASWNAGAEYIKGYSAEEVLGRHFSMFYIEEDRKLDKPAHALSIAQSEGRFADEGWRQHKDGSKFWASIVINALHDRQGKLTGFAKITRDLTEQALQDEQGRTIFDAAPTGMALVSLEGRWLRVNEALCRMLGYSERELLATNFQNLTHPDDLQTDLAQVQSLLNGETDGYQIEKRYFHKRGATVWTNLSVSLIRRPDGKPLYFISQIQDVTDRKRFERVIQESEAKYRALVEDQSDLISLAQPDGLLLFVNAAYAEFFLTTPEEMIGTNLFDYVAESDKEALYAHWRRVVSQRAPIQGENRSRLPDGSTRWVLWTNRAILGADGAALIHSVGRDITERKQAEQALGESTQRYQSLYSRTPVMMHSIDSHGHLLNVSDQWLASLGYRLDEVIGRKSSEFLTPESRLYAQTVVLPEFMRNGRISDISYQFVRKDGSIVDILLSAVAERDAAGNVARSLAVLTDVTERNRTQSALALAHSEALRARADAENAARSKSEYLANMSHEIRTPMNAIMGLTRLALEADLTSRQAQYLQKIEGASAALLRVLNDILDYSKIEAGKLDIEAIPFNLEEKLQAMASLFLPAIEEKGLELFIHIDRKVPRSIVGDPLRLEQVLNNLVGNAVKFTERGEIHLSVSVDERRRDRAIVRFSVRDTGIGLSPEQTENLFDAFEQADSSITRRFGGSGLGLTICRSLVELMGGAISVSSALGEGSVFTFTIDAQIREEHQDSRLLDGLRTLIVDDQETSLAVMQDMFDSWHAQVTTIADAASALAEVKRAEQQGAPFQLVILDWRMPKISGLELAREIRHSHGSPPTIIMVTAHQREALLAEAGDLQLDGVLDKPVIPSVLQEAIWKALYPASKPLYAQPAQDKDPYEILKPLVGARVLLVEDNSLNQEVAAELLQKAGLQVDVAGSGAQAIEKMSSERFDIVLMDLHMPGMDGLQATRQIRKMSGGRTIPIIAMSAAAMERDKAACFAAGMNGHVAKPIMVEQLFETLLGQMAPRASRTTPVAGAQRHKASSTRVPLPSSPAVWDLPDIPGIDSADAAKRLRGDATKYRKYLSIFLDQFGAMPEKIDDDLREGRTAQALAALHTIRGAAGNLAITRIAALAGLAEEAIRTGEQHPDDLLLDGLHEAMADLVKYVTDLTAHSVRH